MLTAIADSRDRAQAPSQSSAGTSFYHSAQSQQSSNKISASLPPSLVTTPSSHLSDPALPPEQHPGPAVGLLSGLGQPPAAEVDHKPKCPPVELLPIPRLASSQVSATSSFQPFSEVPPLPPFPVELAAAALPAHAAKAKHAEHRGICVKSSNLPGTQP